MRQFLHRILPDRFVLALVLTVGLATLAPASGSFAKIVDVAANGLVALLFFFVGAKLSPEAIRNGASNWRLHLGVIASTFVMFPLVGLLIVSLADESLHPSIATGILFLVVLPSTVQSSIALTSMARGNVAAAVTSASLSQILGVFAAPLLLHLIARTEDAAISFAGFGKIALLILLPFAVGQLARPKVGKWVADHKTLVSLSDRGTILMSVYAAFSKAVLDGVWGRLQPEQMAILIAICVGILGCALLFTAALARLLKLDSADSIAFIFCGTKKSLVQGAPLARILFSGPDLGLIMLPIMIFHQIQLMACAMLARHFARRIDDV